MNISGVLVHAYPEHVDSVGQSLAELEGVEVHGNSNDGKIVVTVEQNNANHMSDILNNMQTIPGVLSASMVYHQFEE